MASGSVLQTPEQPPVLDGLRGRPDTVFHVLRTRIPRGESDFPSQLRLQDQEQRHRSNEVADASDVQRYAPVSLRRAPLTLHLKDRGGWERTPGRADQPEGGVRNRAMISSARRSPEGAPATAPWTFGVGRFRLRGPPARGGTRSGSPGVHPQRPAAPFAEPTVCPVAGNILGATSPVVENCWSNICQYFSVFT